MKKAKWECARCGLDTEIDTDDIYLLQLGDRMASSFFTYCQSEKCDGKLTLLGPSDKAAWKLVNDRYKKNGLPLSGSSSDFPLYKEEK